MTDTELAEYLARNGLSADFIRETLRTHKDFEFYGRKVCYIGEGWYSL